MTVARGWAVDTHPWKVLNEAMKGRTWRRVNLHSDYRHRVPEHSGVYVMCVDATHLPVSGTLFDNLCTAVYVGKASSLRVRFGQHLIGDRAGLKQAIETFRRITFYFTSVDRSDLSYVEQSLIDALGPSVNAINASRATTGASIKARLHNGVALGRRD